MSKQLTSIAHTHLIQNKEKKTKIIKLHKYALESINMNTICT